MSEMLAHNLTLDQDLSPEDALAQIGEFFGLDDDECKKHLPIFKEDLSGCVVTISISSLNMFLNILIFNITKKKKKIAGYSVSYINDDCKFLLTHEGDLTVIDHATFILENDR